ncbi:hypothetical protein FE783_03040 [Paenibacillus mesophilus]|uniref:hypothetical protein n=1 Tax=Paenibacillus mesophilus TaxID=2582849 RepID=UPI00110E995D|nr:hypothetical protein [Paenibacillus mesophilus]TMV51938.1 hypothetical protein FE783_03040 [Paenibacillus mesophilus]
MHTHRKRSNPRPSSSTRAQTDRRAKEGTLLSPLSDPSAAKHLQRTIGNRAVGKLLASHTGNVVQRQVVWGNSNHPNTRLDGFASKLDDLVQEGAEIATLNPEALPDVDNYTTLWKRTASLIHGVNTKKINTDDEDLVETLETAYHFAPARFGYAIESYATGTKFNDLRSSLPKGYSIATQVSHGPTRPDLVVYKNGKEVGWFDITSSGSTGHIYGKIGSSWTTKAYVAEVTYDPLNTLDVGTGSMSTDDIQQMKEAFEAEQQEWNDFLQSQIDTFTNIIVSEAKAAIKNKGDLLSKKELSTLTKAVLNYMFDTTGFTGKPASAMLRAFGINPEDYCIKGHGTKREGYRLLREYKESLE